MESLKLSKGFFSNGVETGDVSQNVNKFGKE